MMHGTKSSKGFSDASLISSVHAANMTQAQLNGGGVMVITQSKQVSSHAQCAKDIRAELAKVFPLVKFRIRSQCFAGGNSVDVSWDLGPTTRQVDAITKKYQHGSFDGMTDCYNYAKASTPSSAKFVQTQRSYPRDIYQQICRDYAALLGEPLPEGREAWNHTITAHRDCITSLVNRLLSVFDLPNGYQGIESVPFDGSRAGFLEEFYNMVGGIRQERY